MIFWLKILGAVVALAWGVWLGLPGRYAQRVEDIEEIMDSGIGRRRKVKRIFTPVAWLQRQISARSNRRNRGFQVKSPDDR